MNSEQYEIILNSIGVGVLCLNVKGETLFANPKALEMIGMEQDEILGKNLHKIIHHTREDGTSYPANECPICKAFKNDDVSNINDEVFWHKDESCFSVEYVSAPIKDQKGVVQGAVVVFKDITKCAKAKKEIKESEARLREAQRIARIGHFVYDVQTLIVSGSQELHRIFDVKSEDNAIDLYFSKIHPDDIVRVQNAIASTINQGKDYDVTYRLVMTDGAQKWIHAVGQMVSATQMIGTVQDISNIKKAEKELNRKNIALEEVLSKLKNKERETMKNIEINIAKNVMPVIERMRGCQRLEKTDLNELEESIREVGSGFNRNLMLLKGNLSDQEMKICRLVYNGNQAKEIAARLNVSLETVKTYKKRIRKKLNLASRAETLKKVLSQYAEI